MGDKWLQMTLTHLCRPPLKQRGSRWNQLVRKSREGDGAELKSSAHWTSVICFQHHSVMHIKSLKNQRRNQMWSIFSGSNHIHCNIFLVLQFPPLRQTLRLNDFHVLKLHCVLVWHFWLAFTVQLIWCSHCGRGTTSSLMASWMARLHFF